MDFSKFGRFYYFVQFYAENQGFLTKQIKIFAYTKENL